MIKKFFVVAAALATFALSGEARAATVACGNVSYTANTADQSTAVCSSGNLNESGDLTFAGMTYGLAIRDTGNAVSGGPLSWSTDPMSNELGTGLLSWGINLVSDWVGLVLLELKQGPTYALFDVSSSCDFVANTCAGTWSTAGPGRDSNNLSHTRAWIKSTEVSPVPIPAAGFMLVAALFGLGAMRLRKV